jgi:hypothetical protein
MGRRQGRLTGPPRLSGYRYRLGRSAGVHAQGLKKSKRIICDACREQPVMGTWRQGQRPAQVRVQAAVLDIGCLVGHGPGGLVGLYLFRVPEFGEFKRAGAMGVGLFHLDQDPL